jgi:hypothetical protein
LRSEQALEPDRAKEEPAAAHRVQRRSFRGQCSSDAGHVWNDRRSDFGIDGHIEFVDAATQVSGYAVAAQVKGTAAGFPGENQTGFRYTCEAHHIDYWLRCGRPTVLICVNVRDQQAWWKRLDT